MSRAATARPRHRGWWIAAIIIVLLVGWGIWHRPAGKPARAGGAVQVVSAARAVSGSMPEQLDELGTVTPISTVNVLP